MLGQPIFDDSSSISDVVRDIEAILEKLIDEKQKIDLVNQAVESGKYIRAGTPKDTVIIYIYIYIYINIKLMLSLIT